ncbi:hypothetical protein BH10PSE5_BH10PSE5_22060 [soil metagenome]
MTTYYNYYSQPMAVSGSIRYWFQAKATDFYLTGTSTNDQVSDGNHATVLSGGGGDDTYYVGGTSNIPGQTATIVVEAANNGVDTVIDYSDYKLAANVENLKVIGVHTGVGNNLGNLITADATSRQTLDGSGGNDVLVGGDGVNTFRFEQGSGYDAVYNFAASGANHDFLQVGAYGFSSFADVSKAMVQQGDDVVLRLDANDAVLIRNVTVGSLTADDFLLQMGPKALASLKPAFGEDFNKLSLYDPATGQGVWKTNFCFGTQRDGDPTSFSSHSLNDGEKMIYVDTNFAGSGKVDLGINPFSVDNGVMTITAQATPADCQSALWDFQYTSGLLTTQTSFSQVYGYFEIRADLPEGKGMWPAFWLTPTDGTWPPELDVFEQVGSDTVYQTSHSEIGGHNVEQSNGVYLPNLTTGFHTFSVLWTAEKLTWYVDGDATFSAATPADMHKPMFMLVNLGIGGYFPGDPDATTPWPAQLSVDYIRAYSLEQMNSIGMGSDVQTFTGTKAGDTYLVDNGADKILEGVNGGIDTVNAAVSFTLGDNVENLNLTGLSASNGTGNGLANIIVGNAASNVINGAGGNDTLTGGAGADTFVFNFHSGSDVVTDFGKSDILDISAYTRFGYAPMLVDSGSDTLVAFGSGDVIRLMGVHTNEVSLDSFGYVHHA